MLCLSSIVSADELRSVYLQDLASTDLEKIIEGKMTDLIVKVPAGSCIPLDLFLTGELLKASGKCGIEIEVLKTFYIKAIDKQLILGSLDGINFEPLGDYITGNLSVGLHKDDNDVMRLKIESNLNLKK